MHAVPEPHIGSGRGDREAGLQTDTGADPRVGGGRGGGETTEMLEGSEGISGGGGVAFFFGGRGLGWPLDCCCCC